MLYAHMIRCDDAQMPTVTMRPIPEEGLVNSARDQKPCKELCNLDRLNRDAEKRWASKLVRDNALTRPLVSFQANKGRAVYRWYKYKEAFSAALVEHFLGRYQIRSGVLLDPFAGSGTAMFAASGMGMKAEGIELLPIGQTLITTKQIIDSGLDDGDISRLEQWRGGVPWKKSSTRRAIDELRITRGAYPAETLDAMERYLGSLELEPEKVRSVLLFALLCVVENISYTRKDGQYLRWDHRSGRRQGKKLFDKGNIPDFDKAITEKLDEILGDLRATGLPNDFFQPACSKANTVLHAGSCLQILPLLRPESYDCVVTSPPYCNRYDYTRTYALELALLGVGEEGVLKLRQEMLSCTVENRAKDLLSMNPEWSGAVAAVEGHHLLQSIIGYLESQKSKDQLNNSGIPRMVRGYFYEMACVVQDCGRVLKRGGRLLMVNDNVRYAGAAISVDIILSEIAEQLGFIVENILVLPNGKGNSSQQMGTHGREALRKCVYVWRKK